jgi:hypothetical protein
LKKYILVVFLSAFSFSKAQEINACKCDLLKKSEDSLNTYYSNNHFKPSTKKETLKPHFNFISIKYLKKYSKSQDIIDSVQMKINNEISKIPSDTTYISYKISDSIDRIEYSKKYGDIPRPVIIKTGEFNGTKAILYRTRSYYNPKYYLRISNNNGRSWKNYYTGIEGYQKYFFKSNSQYPLWKDKDNIQIEADIVRMIQQPSFPSSPVPEYETIKNNALITLNLTEILKDSDDDGINDMEENLIYFTNPLSKDTDNDGINDFEDENPRYKNIDNDFTRLIEAILFGNYEFTESSDPQIDEFIIKLNTVYEDISKQRKQGESFSKPREKSFLDLLNYKVVTTDDENIRKINTYGEKIIFLTSKELIKHSKYNYNIIPYPNYSRILKCDDKKDTYILTFDGLVRGETYLMTKTSEGWIVRIINRWIT